MRKRAKELGDKGYSSLKDYITSKRQEHSGMTIAGISIFQKHEHYFGIKACYYNNVKRTPSIRIEFENVTMARFIHTWDWLSRSLYMKTPANKERWSLLWVKRQRVRCLHDILGQAKSKNLISKFTGKPFEYSVVFEQKGASYAIQEPSIVYACVLDKGTPKYTKEAWDHLKKVMEMSKSKAGSFNFYSLKFSSLLESIPYFLLQ